MRGPRNRTRPRKRQVYVPPHQPASSSVEDLIKLRSDDNIANVQAKPLDTVLGDNIHVTGPRMPLVPQSSSIDDSPPPMSPAFDFDIMSRVIPTGVAPEDSTGARNGWLERKDQQKRVVVAELTKQSNL